MSKHLLNGCRAAVSNAVAGVDPSDTDDAIGDFARAAGANIHAVPSTARFARRMEPERLVPGKVRNTMPERADGAARALGDFLQCDRLGQIISPGPFAKMAHVRIARRGMLGLVAIVIHARDHLSATAFARDGDRGRSAGIATAGLRPARGFGRDTQAGVGRVNLPNAGIDRNLLFCGRKVSDHWAPKQGEQARKINSVVKTAFADAG